MGRRYGEAKQAAMKLGIVYKVWEIQVLYILGVRYSFHHKFTLAGVKI